MARVPHVPAQEPTAGTNPHPRPPDWETVRAKSASGRELTAPVYELGPSSTGAMTMSDQEFVIFRQWVAMTCAMDLGDEKRYLFETRLARLLIENQCVSFSQFYELLNATNSTGLRDRVIDAMTTHETTWFRDKNAWLALQEDVLPELLQRCGARGTAPRIWSAACSTGQEPYSIAMLIDELCRAHPEWLVKPESVTILATDISLPALVVAMAGRYDSVSMRRGLIGTWERLRTQYFTQNGPVSVLSPEIRRRVVFRRQNLQDSFDGLGPFDLILTRYVAMYFSARFKEQLWPRMMRVMRESGSLLLGATEALPSGFAGMVTERHGRIYIYRTTNERARM